jgi:hypothetical protein
MEDTPPMRGIQSLFATDLFHCFPAIQREEEVPAVNKPRRACLYVCPYPLKGDSEAAVFYSELFFQSTAADWLRDD